MNLTRSRLSDGREILFFDDLPRKDRDIQDRRELPPRPPQGMMRRDPLTDEWVSIASHRQSRTHLPPSDQCPLCPTTDRRESEIPAADYDVVVFENRFPSFSGFPDQPGSDVGMDDDAPVSQERPANGRCEVIAFAPSHTGSFGQLGTERARTVIDAWAHRTLELSQMAGVEQVFPFENRGQEIGVTLHHPHGQIYAYPFVTPRTRAMIAAARTHFERTGRHVMADVLASERAGGERVVVAGERWTAFVPFAARMPLEVHIVPHRHVADLSELDHAERDELAEIYPRILRGLDALYDSPTGYISAWHQAPVRQDRELGYLHLQITSPRRAADKLKYLAGSEAAMGAFIGDVVPEETARRLREAVGAADGAPVPSVDGK